VTTDGPSLRYRPAKDGERCAAELPRGNPSLHSQGMAMSTARFLAGPVAIFILSIAALAAEPQANYLVGRAKTDITGPCVGLKMLGYVRPDQITAGLHLRQWSRAFVVAEPDGKRRLAIVTTDLQSVTHSLVLSVLEKLKKRLGDVYHLENTIIAATHTHAVPGGYWQYAADTALGSPFYQEYYDVLTEGIAESIVAAHNDLKPGRIFVATGEVEGAGANRSQAAYLRNPESERQRYRASVDTEMTLLRFDVEGRSVGILNWYPVHPTSMSYRNRLISGDNKGYASYVVEHARKTVPASDDHFVAAFAQSNGGDVTPNLTLDQRGPGSDEFESTRLIGGRQAATALRLIGSAGEPLAGPIDCRQSYVDFTRLTVGDEFTHDGPKTTSPAAYGYSFAAGSTEDGGGQPLFREGMTRPDPFIETLAKAISPLPPAGDALRQVHRPKPILLALGAADPPVLPQILPVSVARIGQLALAVGPAEFTTMSGRRFRDSIRKALPDVRYVAIAGYANDYAGYVATREEYEVQHYEGAATLYGPWTQAGYQQEFARLAGDMAAGRKSASAPAPADVRGTVRPTPLGTLCDRAPASADFGEVVLDVPEASKGGDAVSATFWTGNPQNGYRCDRTYARVERWEDGGWVPAAADGDWEVKCRWTQPTAADARDPLAAHQVTIEWKVPDNVVPGKYRITHIGAYKSESDGRLHEFEAHSHSTIVR
jgi:neutral ceramidase